MGLLGLVIACSVALYGILARLAKSTDHPRKGVASDHITNSRFMQSSPVNCSIHRICGNKTQTSKPTIMHCIPLHGSKPEALDPALHRDGSLAFGAFSGVLSFAYTQHP